MVLAENKGIKMKQVINGKTYNTETMTTLVIMDCYNNGNWCGSNSIRITKNGAYAYVRTANGQDLYREASIEAINKDQVAELIDGWKLTDEEAEIIIKLEIIKEA